MVAWRTELKTPEYPGGRPLVIVANDCTVQSGSFGVAEDEFFDKVSKYARAGGLPRLHLACNSGARIGLAEELKPYFKVAWNDMANEAAGYKYLYLSEEDLAKLPKGCVSGEFITEGGEKRYKLNFIVGEKDGIGVENLRGSGLIAGETSQAYAETLTGRSSSPASRRSTSCSARRSTSRRTSWAGRRSCCPTASPTSSPPTTRTASRRSCAG